jgi:lysophospholipase L1-like esterase
MLKTVGVDVIRSATSPYIRVGGNCIAMLFFLSATTAQSPDGRMAAAARLKTPVTPATLNIPGDDVQRDRSRPIERPEALVPFFEQLRQVNAPGSAPVHIVHFGDSHTASDDLTVRIRQLLQERFGDGGPGFALAGHPFKDYRRFDVRSGGTAGWHTVGLLSSKDTNVGLGGVSIWTRETGQSVFMSAECDYVEIYFLQQPGGGDLALFDQDRLLEKFSTTGEHGAGVFRLQLNPGSHRFVLKTLSARPVRLFGWVADKHTGVTYESTGIDGVEASIMLGWDEKIFATYLERRDPSLVVLAYGTNEAIDRGWNSEKYHDMFSSLLQRIRRAAPHSSILVLGPPDCWTRSGGSWHPASGLEGIIEAQKKACHENDCAFWDTRQRMGGPGSMRKWVRSGVAHTDYIHFTPAGYRQLSEALVTDVMRLYDKFGQVRLELLPPALKGRSDYGSERQ